MVAKKCVSEFGKKYVLGVFVDFQGAFDNLIWECVIGKMRRTECKEIKMWMSYFSDRVVCVKGVNDVVWRKIEEGCPQGSICGPAVWNMMMDDLLNDLMNDGCEVIAYADDLLLIVEGMSRSEIEKLGTRWMKVVTDWGKNVGLNVSENKTVMMLMKGKLAANRYPNVRLNDKCIKYVCATKYLGITVSERMRFKVHIESMRGKVLNAISGLRRVLRKDWGLGRRAVRIIYKGLLTACVMYGAIVWYECLSYGYGKLCMARCERVALYACVRVCRTVSTDAMRVIMGELPWALEAMVRACTYKIRNNISMADIDCVCDEDMAGKSSGECKRFIKTILMNKWQHEWDTCGKGRTTYEWIKDVKFVSKCNWFDPGLALGFLMTGHGSMNAYLFERKLAETNRCDTWTSSLVLDDG